MSTNPDIPNKETDLYPITSQRVEELNRVIADKLKPWKEIYMRKKEGLHVTDYYGRKISYTGVSLSGSPMLVLWDDFIEPFLKNGAVGILKDTCQMCAEKNLPPQEYMIEAGKLLKLLNRKTYESMGNLCSKSRNSGFSNDVTSVNIDERISDMISYVDIYAKATLKEGKVLVHFPTPSGARWTDVEMYLMDEDHFKIKVRKVQKVITYSEMGFKKDRSIKKTKLWVVLLKFAMADNSPVAYYDERATVEKDVQRLNKVLINYFGISGNPIEYKRDKKGYVAEFKVFNKSYLHEHINSKAQTISEEERLDEGIDDSF